MTIEHEEHEYLRAVVFKMMMSPEVETIDGPLASKVFDLVSDQSEAQADEAIRAWESMQSQEKQP